MTTAKDRDDRDDKDDKDTPKRTKKDATPEALTFPKTLYHEDGRTTMVANAAEEKTWTKEGFSDSPLEGEMYRQPGTSEPPIADPRPNYYVAPWTREGVAAKEAREAKDTATPRAKG
jgi:hypothetical protein